MKSFRCSEDWPNERTKKAMMDHAKCTGKVWLELSGELVDCDCICHRQARRAGGLEEAQDDPAAP